MRSIPAPAMQIPKGKKSKKEVALTVNCVAENTVWKISMPSEMPVNQLHADENHFLIVFVTIACLRDVFFKGDENAPRIARAILPSYIVPRFSLFLKRKEKCLQIK